MSVVSVDGLDIEMGSTLPRSEYTEMAHRSAEAIADRLRAAGIEDVETEVRPGRVTRGVLIFAEEREADLILVGASKRGAVAKRVLGDVSLELVSRSRRPVMVIAPPQDGGPNEDGGRYGIRHSRLRQGEVINPEARLDG